MFDHIAALALDLFPPNDCATESYTAELSSNTFAFSSQLLSSEFLKCPLTAFLISFCSPANSKLPLSSLLIPPSPTNITFASDGNDFILFIVCFVLSVPSPCSTPIIIEPLSVVSISKSSPSADFLFFNSFAIFSVGCDVVVSLLASAFFAATPISSAN